LKEASNQNLSNDEILKHTEEILNWEKDIKKSDKILSDKSNVF